MSSEYNYYSIILKDCSQREKLAARLEKTLLRGRMAIKMALDNIPSVIIYKGNVDNIIPVFNAFAAEYAVITVLPDGVPAALPIVKKYRDFLNLNPKLQTMLTRVPENLWLGEAIHRIIPASFLDETGALVITSHAVYFIDKPAGNTQGRWLIIPYSHIHAIETDEQHSYLSIHHHDNAGRQHDIFTLPPDSLAAARQAIEQAKAAERYTIRLKTFCPACDYAAETLLAHTSDAPQCPSCGHLIKRTILS
jgi:ribosomal protein S27AE